jgi:hypothetical protein
MTSQSRHSCLTVLTHLSATAFALGARKGVRITSIPSAAKMPSNCRELAVSVVDEKAPPCQTVFRVDAEVACLLDHQWTVGIGAPPADVHAPGRELDERQHVDARQKTPSRP